MLRRKKKYPVGKKVGKKLYIHRDCLNTLPEEDLVLIREALVIKRAYHDDETWNLIRFIPGGDDPIAFLTYDLFETAPHPELVLSVKVDPSADQYRVTMPRVSRGIILHRKETMVCEGYPGYANWCKLTKAEERAGLYDKYHRSRIGRRTYWNALLGQKGLVIFDGELRHVGDIQEWQLGEITDGYA